MMFQHDYDPDAAIKLGALGRYLVKNMAKRCVVQTVVRK